MITITDAAKERIMDLLIDERNPNLKLRTFVQGGGCSGFQYGFVFDEVQNEDDFEFEITNGYKLLVDSMSMQYMTDAVLDYREELMGSSFHISNPSAQTTCGCGSSFSI